MTNCQFDMCELMAIMWLRYLWAKRAWHY